MELNKIILSFVFHCDRKEITPDEKHIDSFLDSLTLVKNAKKFRNSLICFCFYYWERRNDKEFMAQLLGLS